MLRLRWLACSLVLAFVLTGCNGGQGSRPTTSGGNKPPPVGGFSVEIPNNPRFEAVFNYGTGRYSGPDFIAAAKRDVQDQMGQVGKREQLGESVRIVLPKNEKASMSKLVPEKDWARAGRFVDEYFKLINQARADAVKQSGLFGRVVIEQADLADPMASSTEYVLFKNDGDWILKDAKGRRDRLMAGTTLPVFIGFVDRGLTDIKKNNIALITHQRKNPDRLIFGFDGREYTDLLSLDAAIRVFHEAQAAKTRPIDQPLGDKARIIMSNNPKHLTSTSFGSAANDKLHADAFRAFGRAVNRRTVEIIRRSRMFDKIDVEEGEIDEPADLGHEWLLWQKPGRPLTWYARYRGGDVAILNVNGDPVSIAPSIADQLRPLKN